MRYRKQARELMNSRLSRRTARLKWWDLHDFLTLRDLEETGDLHAPLPQSRHFAIEHRGTFSYHRLGQPLPRGSKW